MLVSELAANVMSLLRSEASWYSAPRLSIDYIWFELNLPQPISVGVEFLVLDIFVGAWDAGAAPAPAGGLVLPALSVVTAGEDAGLSL